MIQERAIMSKYKVYAIQHKGTGRIYVGSTTQEITERFMQHIWALRRGKHSIELMQDDFDKYGEDYDFFDLGEYNSFIDNHFVGRQEEHNFMDKYGTDNPAVGYNYNDPYFRKKRQFNIKNGEPIPNEITFEEDDEE